MKSKLLAGAAALSLGLATLGSTAHAQGVSDTEILIGSNQDMSGIFAGFGAPAMNAAKLYLDEVNANGGVHGRTIRLIVEDHAYQLPKAMQGLNKLVNSDKVFAMLMSLGTPMNIASFKLQEAREVANVIPLSAARQMLEGDIAFKYIGGASYYDQIRMGINYLAENAGAKTICAMYLPTDFGKEIQEGAVDQAATLGLTFAAETKHKPDESDFVGTLGKLKEAGCDTIAIALGLRQVITAVATAKKMGWDDVNFLGSSAAFHTAVAKVPGGVTNNFYAASGWQDMETRMDVPEVKSFVDAYVEAYGEQPGTGALLGRSYTEILVRGLEAAGRDLTPDSFRAGMQTLEYEDKLLGADIKFGEGDHLGADAVVISQIVDGTWQTLGSVIPD